MEVGGEGAVGRGEIRGFPWNTPGLTMFVQFLTFQA